MRSAGRALKTEKKTGPNPALWPKAARGCQPLEFRRAPLLAAVCWFALGEVWRAKLAAGGGVACCGCAAFALTLVGLRRSLRMAMVPLAVVWMAVGFWCAEVQPRSFDAACFEGYADGLSRQVRGRRRADSECYRLRPRCGTMTTSGWWAEKEEDEAAAVVGMLSVDLQVSAVEEVTPDVSRMVPMSGGVRINVVADRAGAPQHFVEDAATMARQAARPGWVHSRRFSAAMWSRRRCGCRC